MPTLEIGERVRVARVVREAEAVLGDRGLTVRIDEVQAAGTLARAPRPRAAAGRMPAGGVQCRGQRSQAYDLTRLEHIHVADRWHGQRDAVLRIIMVGQSVGDHRRARGTRDDARTARILDRRDATRVVVVRVRVEDDLDVGRAEAEGRDVLEDERGGVGETAVDEDMALLRCDQQRREAVSADVVRVAEQAQRCLRRVPLGAARAPGGIVRHGERGALGVRLGRREE